MTDRQLDYENTHKTARQEKNQKAAKNNRSKHTNQPANIKPKKK